MITLLVVIGVCLVIGSIAMAPLLLFAMWPLLLLDVVVILIIALIKKRRKNKRIK
jgi:hypothetical protein